MRFTVVTPVLNGARFIDETILSVFGQAGAFSIRYHVQDGGSNDGTLEKLMDWRSRYGPNMPPLCEGVDFSYSTAKDRGLYDAISCGFPEGANGDVMAWINADDRYEPGAFAAAAAIFSTFPDVHWITGRTTIINETGSVLAGYPAFVFPREAILVGLFDGRFAPPLIQQEGTFWRTRLWSDTGGVNPEYALAGDFDLWRRFAKLSDLVTVDAILACFRQHPNQRSRDRKAYLAEIDRFMSDADKAARERLAHAYRTATPKTLHRIIRRAKNEWACQLTFPSPRMLSAAVNADQQEAEWLRAELDQVYRSASWRITAPLRLAKRLIR